MVTANAYTHKWKGNKKGERGGVTVINVEASPVQPETIGAACADADEMA